MCQHQFEGLSCQNYKGDKAQHTGKRTSPNNIVVFSLHDEINNALQVRDLQLTRKVTGPAGHPGPLVVEANRGGPAAATQKVSLELHAEETPPARGTAEQKEVYLSN